MYGHAKVAAEGLGFNYRAAFGIDFFALRFATVCAPGKLARHVPIALHSRLIENGMLGLTTSFEQGGDERDDIVYVRDVAQAIGRAVTTPHHGAEIYNAGQGRGFGLQDMAQAIRKKFPGARYDIGPGYDFMKLGYGAYNVLDISKAGKQLGYAPQYDLDSMVVDYVAALERFGITPTAS